MIGKEGHPESMETTRVSQREAQGATGEAALLELCPACHRLVDLAEQAPLQHVSLSDLWRGLASPKAVQQLSAGGAPGRRGDGFGLQSRGS